MKDASAEPCDVSAAMRVIAPAGGDQDSPAFAASHRRWLAAVLLLFAGMAAVSAVAAAEWRRLPDFPQPPGRGGILAGQHRGIVIVAGGADFPDKPYSEGGVKKYHDDIHVLVPGERFWRTAGRLPEPRAYAAVASIPAGVIVAGGENAAGVRADVMLLRWDGERVVADRLPDLPAPRTGAASVASGGRVFVAGGACPGTPRVSARDFWCLDSASGRRSWQRLPGWDGPSRTQAVVAAVDGGIYLMSGLNLSADVGGKARSTYLRDAHCYRAGKWTRIPDMPWATVAAPSPAPVTLEPPRFFVLGGVDGAKPLAGRAGMELPNHILCFDLAEQRWRTWTASWPHPVVTSPAVKLGARWIIPSGEIAPGVRTPRVWEWLPDAIQVESKR